jgi:hypothetical protein
MVIRFQIPTLFLKKWKSYFFLSVIECKQGSDVRQIEIHTTQLLVIDASLFEVEAVDAKFEKYKSPSSDKILEN